MTNITQEDREAAAEVAVLVEMRELIRAGRADHHAEPFARHREAAAAKERERIVAWLRSEATMFAFLEKTCPEDMATEISLYRECLDDAADEIERKFLGEKA